MGTPGRSTRNAMVVVALGALVVLLGVGVLFFATPSRHETVSVRGNQTYTAAQVQKLVKDAYLQGQRDYIKGLRLVEDVNGEILPVDPN